MSGVVLGRWGSDLQLQWASDWREEMSVGERRGRSWFRVVSRVASCRGRGAWFRVVVVGVGEEAVSGADGAARLR